MLPRRFATTLLFLVSAALLSHAAQLSWGGADALDGTRYKVGAAVVVHVLAPHRKFSSTTTCAVDPRYTDPVPCALIPGGEGAARMMHRAWHTLPLMVTLTLLAAILALASPRTIRWSIVPGVSAVGAVLFVVIVMQTQPPRAFEALQGLNYGIGGNLGMMEVALALLLLPAAMATVTAPLTARSGALEFALLTILIGITLLALRFLDWTPVIVLLAPATAITYRVLAHRLRTMPGVDGA